MLTTTRGFLRDFAALKARARRGETVRVKDREGEFLFIAASTSRRTLLGSAKGRIICHGDITKPTLSEGDWRPGL